MTSLVMDKDVSDKWMLAIAIAIAAIAIAIAIAAIAIAIQGCSKTSM